MVRRVPGCLHVVCAIWTLGFETKSQVVETVEINDSSKAEEQQAILAKAPKDAESATASNGLSLEVSALPDALPRALRSTSSSQSKNFISAQSDLEVGLGSNSSNSSNSSKVSKLSQCGSSRIPRILTRTTTWQTWQTWPLRTKLWWRFSWNTFWTWAVYLYTFYTCLNHVYMILHEIYVWIWKHV